MKVFIWNDPYGVAYGGSICYVVAETVEQARSLAKHGSLRKYGLGDDPAPNIALGEPDHIVDCPCAEWYEWSE
jgi:hypothetical protein